MDLSNNKMPIRLGKCYIQNSVFEVVYDTPYNRKHIERKIVESFKKCGVDLISYPLVDDEIIEKEKTGLTCYANRDFKFVVSSNSISFNCVKDYSGWNRFREFIAIALNSIPTENLIFQTVIIRYISVYPGISIFGKLDGSVKLNCFNNIYGAELRYPITHDGNEFGWVRITNALPEKDVVDSYVDVEVRKTVSISSVDQLMPICDRIHELEKRNFFQIISKSFVEELKPEYETNR